jgi:thiol-disulfide isomerase/thioredoxin
MQKLTLLSVLAILCLHINAQQDTQALHIGERLPDIVLTNIINSETETARLSSLQKDYSRLILLDFWNTYCKPCIRAFGKLDSLQQRYSEQLQIIMVTHEGSAAVQKTLNQWEAVNNRKLSLLFITSDTVLQQYIRRLYNPHYAWIAPDRVLIAQTSSTFVSNEVVEAYLLTMKNDVENRGYKTRDIKNKQN